MSVFRGGIAWKEAYLEPSQASNMELFFENSQQLSKKAPSQILRFLWTFAYHMLRVEEVSSAR